MDRNDFGHQDLPEQDKENPGSGSVENLAAGFGRPEEGRRWNGMRQDGLTENGLPQEEQQDMNAETAAQSRIEGAISGTEPFGSEFRIGEGGEQESPDRNSSAACPYEADRKTPEQNRYGQQEGAKPSGFRPDEGMAYGGMADGTRPNGPVPNGEMPYGGMPNGTRPSGPVPSGEMPYGGMPNGSVPSGAAPVGSMPNGGYVYGPNGSVSNGAVSYDGAMPGSYGSNAAMNGSPNGPVPNERMQGGTRPNGYMRSGAPGTDYGQYGYGQAPGGQPGSGTYGYSAYGTVQNGYNQSKGGPNAYGVYGQGGYRPNGGGRDYGFADAPSTKAEEPLTVGEWILTQIVLLLPVAGLIMMFAWGFGEGNASRKNYCRAALILVAIAIVLGLIFLLLWVITVRVLYY